MDTVRVLRILEYIGPRFWVEKTLATGAVPAQGEYRVSQHGGSIRSAVVGHYPEILEQPIQMESLAHPVDPRTYVELSVDGDEVLKSFIQDQDYNWRYAKGSAAGPNGYSLILSGPSKLATYLLPHLKAYLAKEEG